MNDSPADTAYLEQAARAKKLKDRQKALNLFSLLIPAAVIAVRQLGHEQYMALAGAMVALIWGAVSMINTLTSETETRKILPLLPGTRFNNEQTREAWKDHEYFLVRARYYHVLVLCAAVLLSVSETVTTFVINNPALQLKARYLCFALVGVAIGLLYFTISTVRVRAAHRSSSRTRR